MSVFATKRLVFSPIEHTAAAAAARPTAIGRPGVEARTSKRASPTPAAAAAAVAAWTASLAAAYISHGAKLTRHPHHTVVL